MKEIKWQIVVGAMLCITALEIYALSKGVNGFILSLVIAILAGLAGLATPLEKFIKFK